MWLPKVIVITLHELFRLKNDNNLLIYVHETYIKYYHHYYLCRQAVLKGKRKRKREREKASETIGTWY